MSKRAFKPQCERLEDRANPGTLTATFAAGTLRLTGSVTDDVITLTQPTTGVIQVVGDANTPIQVGRSGPVTAAGTPVSFGTEGLPVKNLTAKMGRGTDAVTIDLSTTPIQLGGNVSIDLGDGGTAATPQSLEVKDNLSASAPNLLTVGKNFTAIGGKGVDSYTVSEIATGRNFRVTDKGGDTPQLFVGSNPILAPADPLIGVGGNVTIVTGAGAESFLGLIGLDVQGKTSISTGTGNPTTNQNASVDFGFGSTQTTFFRGGLRVRSDPNNRGADVVRFEADSNVHIGGTGLSVATYGGGDTIDLGDLFNEGKTRISTGAGDDRVFFDGPTKTGTFTGSVVVNTGDGTDELHIGDSGPVQFLTSVSAKLGKGDDKLFLADSGPVTFATGFSATFDGGEGTNTMTVTPGNITGPSPQSRKFA